jgi:hypothetical protein
MLKLRYLFIFSALLALLVLVSFESRAAEEMEAKVNYVPADSWMSGYTPE